MPPFDSFEQFYPFYLSEHRSRGCRRLHFIGLSLGILCAATGFALLHWWLVPAGFAIGYLCAWTGHVVYERNRPATFRHPFYSFLGDWRMYTDMLRGRVAW